ncbi:BlaI/MecI/CopY family transcriptional regulator [Ketobacter sp. MCCC 1A13808]|uniref:BlaI/MecI/CopY family transcriptional regulator n=1 Tax=Ketobacter sp. MCCC 1A13808 TaxID=2602738 RepID=UPI000F1C67AA|nr:BlaI/MecI/CopY family transcriptional regulator [Ketobacter sp. MCCC 1A13808]MVF12575.1 BlaI/MecI/CopY family transcriptional regulator [Ketobacter sp. MCCC 1A13808]RLP55624.1 MAG: hypothetical protein D6160_04270 [Ketobacter sp.]
MVSTTKGLIGWLGLTRKASRMPVLGRRELAVLNILWECGDQSAQQVLDHLKQSDIGLSTVQSTLERLYRKDLLIRNKCGRAFIYRAKVDKTSIISNLLKDIADELGSGEMEPVISGFMEYLASENPELRSRFNEAINQTPAESSNTDSGHEGD